MRALIAAIFLGLQLLLVSCHASPDVRDVTQIDTVEIIRNIRCETREAVSAYPPDHWVHETAIAYGFTFNALEKNGLSGGIGFTFPVSPAGKWILGIDAGVARHREGESVVDMAEVLVNLKGVDCSAPSSPAPRNSSRGSTASRWPAAATWPRNNGAKSRSYDVTGRVRAQLLGRPRSPRHQGAAPAPASSATDRGRSRTAAAARRPRSAARRRCES